MARMARATRKRLGELLMEEGVVREDQLLSALAEQKRTGELLGQTLVRMGLATEDDIAGTIVVQLGLPFLPVSKYHIDDAMTQIFPPRLLIQYEFVPVDRMGNVLVVAAGGLLTPDILSELEQMAGVRILVYVGKPSEVRELISTRFAGAERKEGAEAQLSSLGSMLLGDE
jgi:hypothetical protein